MNTIKMMEITANISEMSSLINRRIEKIKKLTSAHALGSTKRPIRPASLALSIFSNKGTIVEFELEDIKVK